MSEPWPYGADAWFALFGSQVCFDGFGEQIAVVDCDGLATSVTHGPPFFVCQVERVELSFSYFNIRRARRFASLTSCGCVIPDDLEVGRSERAVALPIVDEFVVSPIVEGLILFAHSNLCCFAASAWMSSPTPISLSRSSATGSSRSPFPFSLFLDHFRAISPKDCFTLRSRSFARRAVAIGF